MKIYILSLFMIPAYIAYSYVRGWWDGIKRVWGE